MPTKKTTPAKKTGPLDVDDPRAGTIDDPNVLDPYAHLRSTPPAPDAYASSPAAEEAAAAEDEENDA